MVGERGISKDYRSEKKDYQYWKKYNPKQKITSYQSVMGRGISKKEGLLTSS